MTGLTGVGGGDLVHAVRAETKRIREQSKGDLPTQLRIILERLKVSGLITEVEGRDLQTLFDLGNNGQSGSRTATFMYTESRGILDAMLARDDVGPVALAIASTTVGSFSLDLDDEDSGTVVMKASSNRWQQVGAAAGAWIGARLGGAEAGGLGAIIGGAIGSAVDDCLED